MLEVKVLVFELFAVNAGERVEIGLDLTLSGSPFPACAIAICEVASLAHEPADDSVK